MTIKYLHYTIEKVIHPDTQKKTFNLSHWMYSDEIPHVALRMGIGYFDTYDEADTAHHTEVMLLKFGVENENQ